MNFLGGDDLKGLNRKKGVGTVVGQPRILLGTHFALELNRGTKVTIGTYRPASESYHDAKRERIRTYDQYPGDDTNRGEENRDRG